MNIIFYILDSVRADHLSCYGYNRITTPNIDEVSGEGLTFKSAYTNSTFTPTSGTSILTSTYPPFHRVYSPDDFIPKGLETLPTILKRNGFQTFGIAPRIVARPTLLNRHLDTWINLFPFAESEGLTLAQAINKGFEKTYFDTGQNKDSFFLLWSMQPRPDTPGKSVPEEYQKYSKNHENNLIGRYDDRLYYNDQCLGSLLDFLKDKGEYEDSLIVILSDHGDALGEWGITGHVRFPLKGVTRIPLIMKLPNGCEERVYDGIFESVDIIPTLLRFLEEYGLKLTATEDNWQGSDFFNKSKKSKNYVCTETASVKTGDYSYSVRSKDVSYIRIGPKVSPISKRRKNPKKWMKDLKSSVERMSKLGAESFFQKLRGEISKIQGVLSGVISESSVQEFIIDAHDNLHFSISKEDKLSDFRSELKSWIFSSEKKAQKFVSRESSPDERIKKRLETLGYI